MTVKEGKVLFSRNVKPAMFGLAMVPKQIFLACSTQFVFLTIRIAPGNVVIVASDMCRKSPIMESRYMELHENMCILIFSFSLS